MFVVTPAVSPEQMQGVGALAMMASHSFAGVHLVLAMHEQSGLVLWDVRCVVFLELCAAIAFVLCCFVYT